MIDDHHAISCKYNRSFLYLRHNDIVKAVLKGIDYKKGPIPCCKAFDNIQEDEKKPDVEFKHNGDKWCLDVQVIKPGGEENSFAIKKAKYALGYGEKVIPLVVGYSGTIYDPSKVLLK